MGNISTKFIPISFIEVIENGQYFNKVHTYFITGRGSQVMVKLTCPHDLTPLYKVSDRRPGHHTLHGAYICDKSQ